MVHTRYKIVRYYFHRNKRVIAHDLTLKQAQAHCHDPNTSSRTARTAVARARTRAYGPWFDGYEVEV